MMETPKHRDVNDSCQPFNHYERPNPGKVAESPCYGVCLTSKGNKQKE